MRAAVAIAFAALALDASAGMQETGAASERPRLVVLIVVDQMIPDQLERLRPFWRGGFGRFAEQGLCFTEARYGHAVTETAPGHFSIGTGRLPRSHGIVANDWFRLEKAAHAYCVSDAESKSLRTGRGPGGSSMSPRNLRGEGLVDLLERADPRSQTVSLSNKDRAAIGMGGVHPDVCAWWDTGGTGYMSSTWYGEALPPWIEAWNRAWIARALRSPLGNGWASALPADIERARTAADDRPGEEDAINRRHVFPYTAPKVSDRPSAKDASALATWAYGTPLGDELVLDLARTALEALALGADEHVDLLAVSLSACDVVGHSYGPTSREVTDLLLRDDAELEKLFALCDQKAGKGRWMAVLSADHGVLDLPESIADRGAVRVPMSQVDLAVAAARKAVEERFGQDFYVGSDSRGMRLSHERVHAAGVELAEVERVARDAFQAAAAAWCARTITGAELAACGAAPPADADLRLWWSSWDAERSFDLMFQPKPLRLVAKGAGTSHGTSNDYDRAVPVVFLGPGFRAGASAAPAAPVDIAPTLLKRLSLPLPPGLDGRPLSAE